MQLAPDLWPDRTSRGTLQSSEDVCAGHNAHQLRLVVYHRDAVHLRAGIQLYRKGADIDTCPHAYYSSGGSRLSQNLISMQLMWAAARYSILYSVASGSYVQHRPSHTWDIVCSLCMRMLCMARVHHAIGASESSTICNHL